MRRFLEWLGLLEQDGRRAWGFLALLGGSGVMTAMIAVILWLLRGEAKYLFWLGLAAHAQLAICITGFMAMFVKRNVEVTKDGIKVQDLTVKTEGDVNVQHPDE